MRALLAVAMIYLIAWAAARALEPWIDTLYTATRY